MNATQKKERLYGQLAQGFALLKQHSARTTDLMEDVQEDLDAIRTFSGMHAAQCVPRQASTAKLTCIMYE